MQQFGGFDSVWMTMVATSNTYIESKIQGHISYQFCFCINRVIFFMSKCVYIFLGRPVYGCYKHVRYSRSLATGFPDFVAEVPLVAYRMYLNFTKLTLLGYGLSLCFVSPHILNTLCVWLSCHICNNERLFVRTTLIH